MIRQPDCGDRKFAFVDKLDKLSRKYLNPINHPWHSNRTQVSIKADRQFKEYFYHCVRNIDYPMRLNYCWDFSPAHGQLVRTWAVAQRARLQELRENFTNLEEIRSVRRFLARQPVNGFLVPFKKERDGSATSGSAFGSTSGGGIFSFSVKSLISGGVGKRKKSAPEQELKRIVYDNEDDMTTSGNLIDNQHIPSEYVTKFSQLHLSSSTAVHTYYIYLNESCCVEVTATQQGSTVQNLLNQALRKIKATEDYNEFCLVEHIELEQMLPSPSKEVVDLVAGMSPSSSAVGTLNPITASTVTATASSPATTTCTSLGNITGSSNMLSSVNVSSATSGSSSHGKKVTVKTRILGASENLFILTHVWNQMKIDGRDGFKFAKVILTKRRALPRLHQLSLKKRKQAILAQHRMSLQPKPTTTTTTTTSSTNGTKTTTTTTTTTSSTNVITNKTPASNGSGSRKSSVITSENTSSASGGHLYTSNGNCGARMRPPPKRERSSLNRLVRQKSFQDSSEFLNQLAEKKGILSSGEPLGLVQTLPETAHETCTTVTTTTTEQVSTNGYVDPPLLDKRTLDLPMVSSINVDQAVVGTPGGISQTSTPDYIPHRRVTEIIESTLALSTEIVMSKNDEGEEGGDEEDENELDEDDAGDLDIELDLGVIETANNPDDHNEYQTIKLSGSDSGAARKKSVFINEGFCVSGTGERRLFKANSVEGAKKRANKSDASSQRRQSTFQRLFKLKL